MNFPTGLENRTGARGAADYCGGPSAVKLALTRHVPRVARHCGDAAGRRRRRLCTVGATPRTKLLLATVAAAFLSEDHERERIFDESAFPE